MAAPLQYALKIMHRLPRHQRRQLAEQILRETSESPEVVMVNIQCFPPQKQRRLDALADKNTEGKLTEAERQELGRLVTEAQRLALENAQALLRAQRPELFDSFGRPLKMRVQEAVRSKARAERAAYFKSK